jgi:1-deoxy-D-xylulose-5-phosphate synthase
MLYTAYQHPGPAAIRYPRGTGPGAIISDAMVQMEIGRAVQVRSGERVAILNFGTLLPEAMAAAKQLNATVADMRWVKPMDEEMVLALAQRHSLLVTLEENAVAGGAGAAVNEFLAAQGQSVSMVNLGIPDIFVEHGSHADQLAWTGLDVASIYQRIVSVLKKSQVTLNSSRSLTDAIELARKSP